MAIAGLANIQDARTTFEVLVDGALSQQSDTGAWQSFARRYTGGDALAYQVIMNGSQPAYERWAGEKAFSGHRKLTKTITFDKYHKSQALSRETVVYDKTGATAQALSDFVSDAGYIWDKLVFDKLKTNPTGIDGVTIVNDSHPYGASGGTWDNKTTDALSFASYKAARAAMLALTKENGEPMSLNPRVLLVHPDEEQVALEIAQATDRPVAVGTAGAINAAGIGGSAITNVFRGTIDVVVSPRWRSGDWLLCDPRFAPIGLVVWRDPEAVIADDMEGDERMKRDQFLYSIEADANCDGLQPYGVYGKITP